MRRVLFLLSLISVISLATSAKSLADQRFLPGCTNVGHDYASGNLAFRPQFKTPEKQGIFFIHNLSDLSLTIKLAPTNTTELYPAWQRTIEANNWGAFATDKESINFSCFRKDDLGADVEVNCQDALDVCQYVDAEFGPQNQGNYWVAENLPKIETRDQVIHDGILLRW